MKIGVPMEIKTKECRVGLTPSGGLTEALMSAGVTAIGYETVQLANGSLPLLAPMSEIAGRMAVQTGVHYLEAPQGGRGILLGGVPGVLPANVAILGGGTAGTQAARLAVGMNADVIVIDVNPARMQAIDDLFQGRVKTLMSNPTNIAQAVTEADLVIGSVLIPGSKAPKLVTRDMVAAMKLGSVIIDIAIDQGGCIETANQVTTHEHPTYEVHGVIHYAVANIPGAVPRTSTLALTNVTLPYIQRLVHDPQSLTEYAPLRSGVNVMGGQIVHPQVAKAHAFVG